MWRRLCVLAFALWALPAVARPPKLTLLIVVDAFGTELFSQNRPHLTSALGPLSARGAYFPNVHYLYAETVTAAGHATISTGAWPSVHGIVGNEVVNRSTRKLEPIFLDQAHPALTGSPGQDSAPTALVAEALADRLVQSTHGRGKAVAISAKGRAAIALAGHAGRPYWFDAKAGHFVTSSLGASGLPAWVEAVNAKHPVDAWFKKRWELSLPASSYAGQDDRPVEASAFGLGRAFPHVLDGNGLSAPGKAFYDAAMASPAMIEAQLQLALAAIDGEQLGKDDAPDLLAFSVSSTDAAYHLFGPDSWEVQDLLVRTDRALATLIAAAERAAGGRDKLLVVVTGDHGAARIPEDWAADGLPGARLDPNALDKGLSQSLKQQFGADLVAGSEELDIYLDEAEISARHLDGAAVRRAAAAYLASQPHIACAVAKDDLWSAPDPQGLIAALRFGYFAGRSGDVLFAPRVFTVITEQTTGSAHGSPYHYDDLVPWLLAGPGVAPGEHDEDVRAIDLAPTLAALWETTPPAQAQGQVRTSALSAHPR